MLVSLLAALLVADRVPPTFGSIKGLSPARAGTILLAGKSHGPIEKITIRQGRGMDPPGTFYADLIERSAVQGDHCTRRR